MKAMRLSAAIGLGTLFMSTGCVSLPPVVHVEHKGDQQAVMRRLESIEHRLDRIEPRANEELHNELRRIRAELEETRRELERERQPTPRDE
jgi:hypothetical protein